MTTNTQYAQLVERISRIVRDRGDVELIVKLDRIMDEETDADRAVALGAVVKIIQQKKSGTAGAGSTSAEGSGAA